MYPTSPLGDRWFRSSFKDSLRQAVRESCVLDRGCVYHAGIKDYMQSAILFELIAKLVTATVLLKTLLTYP